MDHVRKCEISLDKLPKSVKVRSTCNACQQAKIRCGHERPSCERCQKHNLECVYSISRRLGRPAKKKDPLLDDPSAGKKGRDEISRQSSRRIRTPKKKNKVKEEPVSDTRAKEHNHSYEDKSFFDTVTFDHSQMDNITVGDSRLRTPTFVDAVSTVAFSLSDNIDMASDSWLQEFMSNPFVDPNQERGIFDSLESSNIKVEDTTAINGLPIYLENFSDATSEAHDMASSSSQDKAVNVCGTESAPGNTHGALQGNTVYAGQFEREPFCRSQPLSTLSEHFSTESSNLFPQSKAPKRTLDYSFSAAHFKASSNGVANVCQCPSHEQAVWDLLRVYLCASRTCPSIAIDSILICQRILQQSTETLLQCRICSRTRVNHLMVVIISIDILITTLDAITSVESDVVDRLFPEYLDPLVQDYWPDVSLANNTRRHKGDSLQLRTQLDACPLIIGDFYVPSEEKYLFVRKVLHTRLSGLLGTVHRIRLCTQEALTVSASRGILGMMHETDRRLRSIMTKLNMLNGQ